MATDMHNNTTMTVDLTGLPESVVQEVKQLVHEARQHQNLQTHSTDAFPEFLLDPKPSPEESRRLLDEMASLSSGQTLPHNFSRADIYDPDS